jgi:hypothetical protein
MTSFLPVSCVQLMSNRQNQHDIFGSSSPSIFRDVTKPAARQYQLMPAVFCLAAQQWMIREKLESSPNAKHPLTRKLWVVVRKGVEFFEQRQAPADTPNIRVLRPTKIDVWHDDTFSGAPYRANTSH